MLDIDALSSMIADIVGDEVSKAVAPLQAKIAELEARPAPEKGEKGDPGDRGEKGADGSNGTDGANGKDGAGVVDGFLNREGHLIATLSDGTTRDFGLVIGKDGEPGKDGKDGLGFDDMDVAVLEDDRTIELSFRRGDEEKAFTVKWPTVIDRGVFNADEQYEAGDGVTWGGQFYIGTEPSRGEKPDQAKGGKPWRLAVRKGRDGKDGKVG